MADALDSDPLVEELIDGLTVDSAGALGRLLSITTWDAIKDEVTLKLDYMEELDQLRYILLLIKASFMQDVINTQICYDAYEYLSIGSLWDREDIIVDWETCSQLIGMPEAVAVAEEGIHLNWGVEAYGGFPEQWSFIPSGFMTCLLYHLSCVAEQEEAKELLLRQRSMNSPILDVIKDISDKDLLGREYEELPQRAPTEASRVLSSDSAASEGVCEDGICFIELRDVVSVLRDQSRQPILSDATHLQTKCITEETILTEIRLVTDRLLEGLDFIMPTDSRVQSVRDDESSVWQSTDEGLRLEYPCFCPEKDYDGLIISDPRFPDQNGWEIIREDVFSLVRLDGADASIEEINSFMQYWLIFGSMSQIFGSAGAKFRASDFIRTDKNTSYLTFILLDRYIMAFAEQLIGVEADLRSMVYETMTQCLSVMEAFSVHTPITSADEGVLLSIEELWRSLSAVKDAVFQNPEETRVAKIFEQALELCQFSVPSSDLPKDAVDFPHSEWYIVEYDQLIGNGWCPRDINMLLNEPIIGGDEYYYFASSMDRRVAGRDHEDCDKDECRSRKLDDTTYQPRHYGECVKCSLVDVDVSKVTQILKDGRHPLISIDAVPSAPIESNRNQNCSLSVTEDGPYVAISHVWSDGLGNVNQNSIPNCQLRRLREQANALFSTGQCSHRESFCASIWIDTLCVPLEPEARKLALRQLGRAYLEADYILVLDEELQNVTLECSEEEKLTRILLSEWMHRLWTMEEASFGASKLRFQFRDGIYMLPDFEAYRAHFRDLNLENIVQSPQLLYTIGSTFIDRLPFQSKYRLKDQTDEIMDPFAVYEGPNPLAVLEGIQHRSTSKEEDEFLCISSIMGLDVKRVAQFSSSAERAEAFYQILTEHNVPVSPQVLFSAEPKVEARGFRWAPSRLSTLQKYLHHAFFYEEICGGRYPDSMGLYCDFPAYFLDMKSRMEGDQYLVTENKGKRKVWQTYLTGDVPTIGKLERKPPLWPETQSADVENAKLAIIVNQSSSSDLQSNDAAAGVLVQIFDEDYVGQNRRKVTRVGYLRPLWNVNEDKAVNLGRFSLAEATWIRPLTWCIG